MTTELFLLAAVAGTIGGMVAGAVLLGLALVIERVVRG